MLSVWCNQEQSIPKGDVDAHAALQRHRREKELLSRTSTLEKSKQYVLIAKDKEEAYWKSQDEKYKVMLARTEMGKKTTKEVQAMLKKRAQASTAALDVISKETVSFGTAEKGYGCRRGASGSWLLEFTVYGVCRAVQNDS